MALKMYNGDWLSKAIAVNHQETAKEARERAVECAPYNPSLAAAWQDIAALQYYYARRRMRLGEE